MKKGKIILVAILTIFVMGCATTGEPIKDPILTNAYRTLQSLDIAYDTAWGAFVQLYKDGLVKEETYQAGRKLAWTYYNNWIKAAEKLNKYVAGELSVTDLNSAVDLARAGLDGLKKYLKEQAGDKLKVIQAEPKFLA